jgi:hypothetical protein
MDPPAVSVTRCSAPPSIASRAELTGDNRAKSCAIADGEKTRIRRFQRERLVDANLALSAAEPRRAIAGDGHDSICRQRLGQFHLSSRTAFLVGHDRSKPERENAKILSHHPRATLGAPAAAVRFPLRCQHAPADDALTVVRGQHLQRFVHVNRAEHVGRLIAGQ